MKYYYIGSNDRFGLWNKMAMLEAMYNWHNIYDEPLTNSNKWSADQRFSWDVNKWTDMQLIYYLFFMNIN